MATRMCLECGTAPALDDSDNCGACDGVECAYCGLTDDDSLQLHQGDRVCLHCAQGHQRVLFGRGVVGGVSVLGPCNCEVL